ncbi:hypothetical protein [Falsiroseomonas oryziterrae]|uniref:hypothetical protein n=1 Tax=Falsiroseomonas oryziterrae TaxID=2911368 RepID=UPI001F28CF0B|nr:hypothetical protein [Roseomonas sp. NPKOSM-4]
MGGWRWSVLALALVAGGVGGAVASSSGLSSRDPSGRYQMVHVGFGVVRLDTATGEMVGCLTSAEAWPAVACGMTLDALHAVAPSLRAHTVMRYDGRFPR